MTRSIHVLSQKNIVVTYLRVLVIIIWTYLQQSVISTYIYTISHGHFNSASYHTVRVSHCWANVRNVKHQFMSLKRLAKLNDYHSSTVGRKYKSRYWLESRHWYPSSDAINFSYSQMMFLLKATFYQKIDISFPWRLPGHNITICHGRLWVWEQPWLSQKGKTQPGRLVKMIHIHQSLTLVLLFRRSGIHSNCRKRRLWWSSFWSGWAPGIDWWFYWLLRWFFLRRISLPFWFFRNWLKSMY